MNGNNFENLVTHSQQEQPPIVDVSKAVWQRIQHRQSVSTPPDPLPLFAGFSLTTAAVALLLAYSTWEIVQDPIMALVEPFRAALP